MFDEQTIRLLFEKAKSLGLNPTLLTEYGLMAIEVDGSERYLFMSASVLNTQLASNLSKNKHATRVILDRYKLPNIPYYLPNSHQEAIQFLYNHKPIIIKPTLGKHSQNVFLASTEKDLSKTDYASSILEKFIDGQEERHLVLQGKVIAVHHKVYDGPINDPSTVKRISIERAQWDMERCKMATDIASIIGLSFAAVDFIVTGDGKTHVLEVNSAPGLSRFQYPDKGPSIDIAGVFLDAMLEKY